MRDGPGKKLILNPNVQSVRHLSAICERADADLLVLPDSAEVQRSTLSLISDEAALAETCKTTSADIDAQQLSFAIPFAQKRRGVETRFVVSDAAAKVGSIVLGTAPRADQRSAQRKAGEGFDDIATSKTATRMRAQRIFGFAFPAPDRVRDIIAGKQSQCLINLVHDT